MAEQGFGSGLWKNVQAIRLGKDGGIEAPVRADGRDGIVAGMSHVAEVDGRRRAKDATEATDATDQRPRGWRARLRRSRT
jgi:hypothetical protein